MIRNNKKIKLLDILEGRYIIVPYKLDMWEYKTMAEKSYKRFYGLCATIGNEELYCLQYSPEYEFICEVSNEYKFVCKVSDKYEFVCEFYDEP